MNDFDWLVGCWGTVQRRLKKPLAASTEWDDEFNGVLVCSKLMSGLVYVDEIDFPTKGSAGVTVAQNHAVNLREMRGSAFRL